MIGDLEFVGELIDDFEERNQFLKKYYPYFKIMGDGTKGFWCEELKEFNLGFILLSTLRYLVEENNFKNRGVTYSEIADFLQQLTNKVYKVYLSQDLKAVMVEEIVGFLTNGGQPYEYHYYDPKNCKCNTTRLVYMKGEIDPLLGSLRYYITDSGIEFYLETKEIKEFNKISIQQVLLEKMVSSKNFKGARQVVKRITNQVAKLHQMKREVLNLIAFNSVEGDRLYREFFNESMEWFDKEEDYFVNNIKLVETAREKTTLHDSDETKRDINALSDELKKASEKYGELLKEVIDLKKKVDEVRSQRKIKVLKSTFDYRSVVEKVRITDTANNLGVLTHPFLSMNRNKFFDFSRIDSLLNLRVSEEEEVEVVVQEQIQDYIFDDVIEQERITQNHYKYLRCLFHLLNIEDEFTLPVFNNYLEEIFSVNIFKNGDYYSFLIALSGKSRYCNEGSKEDITSLEEIIKIYEKENWFIPFEIIFLPEETVEIKSGFRTTNIKFRRLYQND